VLWLLAAGKAGGMDSSDWLSDHSTLIVSLVSVVVAGVLGPAVTAVLTSRREKDKDERAFVAARREELRALLDEIARMLAPAGTFLRELATADREGDSRPEPADTWLRGVFPLVERLRLRLSDEDDVVKKMQAVHTRMVAASEATHDAAAFDQAQDAYDEARDEFLTAARAALEAPLTTPKAK
jgi:hypothetical protein